MAHASTPEQFPYDHELGGWISPEGVFYRALYGDHYRIACEIVNDILRVWPGTEPDDYLVEIGWVRLGTNGQIHEYPKSMTEQQYDILYRCYLKAIPGSWYQAEMFEHIRPLLLDTQTEPMPVVPSQGDQENFRKSMEHRRMVYQCAFR